MDPDFHRRDLADAIEAGNFPQWELGIQTFPDTPEQMFEGIDLLDPTKFVPEELAPVRPIGLMTLNANPTNYFAETEQVAFHPGHLVPGIDITDDPLLSGRLFSYLDTQITRLGGPNFAQIPINRTHAPVNDMLRDGFHQDAVHSGVAPYKPNLLDGGCPFFAGAGEHAFVEYPTPVAASAKVREAPASFADHFSQPRLIWLSLSPVEREHVIAAYTFELSKVYERAIKERVLTVLAHIDEALCREVASGLGLPAPTATAKADTAASAALSQLGQRWPATGRVLGIITGAGSDPGAVRAMRDAALAAGLSPLISGPTGAPLADDLGVQRTFAAARSVEFDALLVADAPAPGAGRRRPRRAGRQVRCGRGRPAGTRLPDRLADQRGLPAREADRRPRGCPRTVGGGGRRPAGPRRSHRARGRQGRLGPGGAVGHAPGLGTLPGRRALSLPSARGRLKQSLRPAPGQRRRC